MGPLISQAQRLKVIAAIDKGEAEGAKLLLDGRGFRHPMHPEGYFLGPTLFSAVTKEMSIYQEEIFGPVLIVLQVPTFAAALNLVNTNQYGNGTAIFTQDGGSARAYVQQVKVGMVGINIPIPVPVVSHPFGGWKRSAFGDCSMHGTQSINFYTRLKTVTSKWLTTSALSSAFVMPTHE